MKTEEIQKLVKIAEESVKDLEEPLKSEGFKTILNRLMEEGSPKPKRPITKNTGAATYESSDHEVAKICESLNRTEFPEIEKITKALDQALFVLLIARDSADVDGLLPSQISKILNTVFRLPTTGAAIGMALGNARSLVDRKAVNVRGGQAYKYRIMREGEVHLQNVIAEGGSHEQEKN